jgi:hypothetical protein
MAVIIVTYLIVTWTAGLTYAAYINDWRRKSMPLNDPAFYLAMLFSPVWVPIAGAITLWDVRNERRQRKR